MNIEKEAMIRRACYEIAHTLLDGKPPEMVLENLGVSQGYASVRMTHSRHHVPIEHIVIACYDTNNPGAVNNYNDTLVPETADATNVKVCLDQWFYKNFVIRDGEGSLAFQDLVDQYLRPAMMSIAEGVDRAILGSVHAFIGGPTDRAGVLAVLTTLARRSESSTGSPGTSPVLLRSSPLCAKNRLKSRFHLIEIVTLLHYDGKIGKDDRNGVTLCRKSVTVLLRRKPCVPPEFPQTRGASCRPNRSPRPR